MQEKTVSQGELQARRGGSVKAGRSSGPAVSIVIPVYNVRDYIAECMQSLLAQTFGDFEAILVDDGSQDDSIQVARSAVAGDTRFRFVSQENAGPSVARNHGIDEARGTFLMFLDPDDYYTPDTLERLHGRAMADDLDYLDFTAHTFYESARARRARNEDYYEHRPDIPGVMSGPELFVRYQHDREYHCSLCFHFFKRALLEESGLRLRDELYVHEDELFSPLLMTFAKRAAFMNVPFYQRRMREQSAVTGGRGMRNVWSMFTVTQELQAWLYEHAVDFGGDYVAAMAQRIVELRAIMAQDAAGVSPDELLAYEATLPCQARVDYELYVIQGAVQHQEFYRSRTYLVGEALLALPKRAREAMLA